MMKRIINYGKKNISHFQEAKEISFNYALCKFLASFYNLCFISTKLYSSPALIIASFFTISFLCLRVIEFLYCHAFKRDK